MRYIHVELDWDTKVATIEIEREHRKKVHQIGMSAYGMRNLPKILDSAFYVECTPGHKKGDRCRYVDALCGGDSHERWTYMFRGVVNA